MRSKRCSYEGYGPVGILEILVDEGVRCTRSPCANPHERRRQHTIVSKTGCNLVRACGRSPTVFYNVHIFTPSTTPPLYFRGQTSFPPPSEVMGPMTISTILGKSVRIFSISRSGLTVITQHPKSRR